MLRELEPTVGNRLSQGKISNNSERNTLSSTIHCLVIFIIQSLKAIPFGGTTPMRVAFLGLGIMGRSMATNLVKAGHEVSVWNRSAGKDVEGARTAASPGDAASGVEVVWMCVSD